jgi:metal-responsive CopG/Arc/MetJ family transcriptional regulator
MEVMTSVSLRLPDNLARDLAKEAKREGKSASALAKEILQSHFLRKNGKEQTMEELIGDLAGKFEGPGDLSFNPKHMEGFGK